MGYGGWLIYSGVIENVKRTFPEKKIIVLAPKNLRSLFKETTSDADIILKNNPDVYKIYPSVLKKIFDLLYPSDKYVILDLSDKNFHHHVFDSPKRIQYKAGKHAIEYGCESIKEIQQVVLQPKLYLTQEEIKKAEEILESQGLKSQNYFCIEIGSKTEFTPNKAWPKEYWLKLVHNLSNYIQKNNLNTKIVQIGTLSTPKISDEVIYLNGLLTFRETYQTLTHAKFLVSYVGGLTHLAKAASCKNIVLKSAWEPRPLTLYNGDIDFYTEIDCKHCGLKVPCPKNIECMRQILPNDVYAECIKLI